MPFAGWRGIDSGLVGCHIGAMPISEAARADLYTGLVEVLGADRAETLMAHLPRFDPADVATRADIAATQADIAELRSELTGDTASLRSELTGDIGSLRSELRGDIGSLRSELKGDIAELRSELTGDIAELRSELTGDIGALRDGLAVVNQRLDRLFLTLVAGLLVIVATMTSIVFTVG